MTENTKPQPVPPTSISADHVVVGVIVGVWGLRGDVKVEVYSDYPDRFAQGNDVYIDGDRFTIIRVRDHKAGYVIGFDSMMGRSAAEALRGKVLTIPSSELPVLDEGTFYYFDIIDMPVRTTNGDELGTVQEILSTNGSDIYVIRGASKEVLIPAVPEYVLDVDTEQGVMTVSLPDGYLNEM